MIENPPEKETTYMKYRNQTVILKHQLKEHKDKLQQAYDILEKQGIDIKNLSSSHLPSKEQKKQESNSFALTTKEVVSSAPQEVSNKDNTLTKETTLNTNLKPESSGEKESEGEAKTATEIPISNDNLASPKPQNLELDVNEEKKEENNIIGNCPDCNIEVIKGVCPDCGYNFNNG